MAVVPFITRVLGFTPAIHLRLGETSGTFANSGSLSAPATAQGSLTRGVASLLNGDADKCVNLAGGTISTPALISSATGITINAFVNFNSFPADVDFLRIGSQSAATGNAVLRYQRSSDTVRYVFADGSAVQELTFKVPDIAGRTYMVTVTHDVATKTARGYLNGRLMATRTFSGGYVPIVNKALVIGGSGLNAKVDEVSVFTNKVLTPAQVRNLYLSAVGADDDTAEWYVSATGSFFAAGTSSDPLDLETALKSGLPLPGHSIWIEGGDYTGSFTIGIAGTDGNPIYLRNVPGEHVRIITPDLATESNLISSANSAYIIIDGDGHAYPGGVKTIQITNLNTERVATTPGSNPPKTEVGGRSNAAGLWLNEGHDIEARNVIIDNCGNGLNGFDAARNVTGYGLILFNNGWLGPAGNDRGHGHSVYESNNNTTQGSFKKIIGCLALNPFAINYKTDSVSAYCDNFTVKDCIASQAGYPQAAYAIEALGVSRSDGSMQAGSKIVQCSGMVSTDKHKDFAMAGAGYNGRAHRSYIVNVIDANHIELAHPALTTVSNARYVYALLSQGAWQNNLLVGSGGYDRPNNDVSLENLALYLPDWGPKSGNAWIGYETPYNNNLRMVELYAAGGTVAIALGEWREIDGENNTGINFYRANISGQSAASITTEVVKSFFKNQNYAPGTLSQPTVKTGRIYRTTTRGITGSTEPVWPTTSGGTVTSGTVTLAGPTTFQTNKAYAKGDLVVANPFNGNTYLVRQAGASGSSTPSWGTAKNALITSGAVVFQCLGDGKDIKPYAPDYRLDNDSYYTTNPLVKGATRPFKVSGVLNELSTLDLTFTQYKGAGFDLHSTQTDGKPTQNVIKYFWQDPEEGGLAGRGLVAVFNWQNLSSVTISLIGSGLVEGQQFEVRDGEDYFNTVLASGTYGTGPGRATSVSVPTTGSQIAKPIGWNPAWDFQTTKPFFMSLVVLPFQIVAVPVPGEPEDFTATKSGTHSIALSWTLPDDNDEGIAIEASLNGGSYSSLLTTDPHETEYEATDLAFGAWKYRIKALGQGPDSDWVESGTVVLAPDPVGTIRTVAWPTDVPGQNAVLDEQWTEGFKLNEILGATANFERIL